MSTACSAVTSPHPPPMNVSGRELGRKLDQLHAGLHPDRFGPSAEQSVVRAVGDAVHLARRTARRLPRDETVIAVVAGLVHVEEGDDVAFANGVAVDVAQLAARRFDDADGHVAGDDRIGNIQLAVMQMHVGAAHFGVQRAQKCRARLELRRRKLPDHERRVWRGHENGGVLHGSVVAGSEHCKQPKDRAYRVTEALSAPRCSPPTR